MYKSLLYLSTLAIIAVVFAPNARADDAYVCDGGRLVYARAETLEKLKQTDPCIAKYYASAPAPKTLAAAPTATASQPIAAIPPQPAPGFAPAPARQATPVQPGGLRKPFVTLPAPTLTRDATLGLAPSLARPAPIAPPQAATGTDYRTVRIINAPNSAADTFHHER